MRALLLFLAAFAVSAHAAYDLECERQITNSHYTFANINLWPMVEAELGEKSCVGGKAKLCLEKNKMIVIDERNVCGYRINYRWECKTAEWDDSAGNHLTQVHCDRWGVTANIVVQPNGQSTLSCYSDRRLERRWRLGICKYRY